MNEKIVTRFAPSPTGFLHVGGIRTALYAWLWARKHQGIFILRIDDTDKKREVSGSISHIQKSLEWLSLDCDFGPDNAGPYGSCIQSERIDIYKKYAYKLIEKGLAYPDPFSEEELEQLRAKAELKKRPFLYREHRGETIESWDEKKPLRFRVPDIKEMKWNDVVYGNLSAGPEALDDFILIKSDGYPTYNFAHIIDDYEMQVTHIFRSNEFISSVPKFLALYQALEIKPPVFVTLPPIMSPSGKKKLSKRDGAKDALDYKKEGYLPDAFINFLALLGWHPAKENGNEVEKEIFTREELIQIFEVDRIKQSGAGFDEKKLEWINKEHIKQLSYLEVEKNILPLLPEGMQKRGVVELLKDRIHKWSDVTTILNSGELDFIQTLPEYDKAKLQFKETDPKQILANLEESIEVLKNIEESAFNLGNIKSALMKLADSRPKRGEVLHPVRFALSGLDRSPDPFIIASILGKNETIQRLQKAIT